MLLNSFQKKPFKKRRRFRKIVRPRCPNGVVRHLFNDHISTRSIGKHRDDPRGVVDCKYMIYSIIIKVTIEFLDQCRTVIQQQLARTVGIEIHFIAMTLTYLVIQSVPLLVPRAVRPATDVLLTAPMTYNGRVGIFLSLAAGCHCQQNQGHQSQKSDLNLVFHL